MESEIKLKTVPINLMYMMIGELPLVAVDEINNHIDNVIIDKNKSYADNLVGQISQDKKSSQLDFDLKTQIFFWNFSKVVTPEKYAM